MLINLSEGEGFMNTSNHKGSPLFKRVLRVVVSILIPIIAGNLIIIVASYLYELGRSVSAEDVLVVLVIVGLVIGGAASQPVILGPNTESVGPFRLLRNVADMLAQVSWLVWRWIIIGLGLVLVLAGFGWAVVRLRAWNWILEYNLIASALFVLFFLQFALRRYVFQRLNWKKIDDPWLKFTGWSGLGLLGLGALGASEVTDKVVAITLKSPYMNLSVMIITYVVVGVLYGLAHLFKTIGLSGSRKDDRREPLPWFVITFGAVWLANWGIYTLYFDCLLVSFFAYTTAA
jgi:hypothetical protein